MSTPHFTATALMGPDGYITAYYDQYPGLVVQGATIDDVKSKLKSVLDSYFSRMKSFDIDIQTKSI